MDAFSERTKRSAKGVQKSVKETLHHELYKRVLFEKTIVRKSMRTLNSKKHTIVLNEVDKIALSWFDDKRYYLDDGVNSLAFGHYRTGSKSSIHNSHDSDGCDLSEEEMSDGENMEGICEKVSHLYEDDIGDGENIQAVCEDSNEFAPPDPGFWQTVDLSSDEENICDWDAPVIENSYPQCSFIDFEAEETDNESNIGSP